MTTTSIQPPHTVAWPAAPLNPKEHGAYAILGIPIVISLLIAGLTVVGTSIAIAAVGGFLAHEPLLVFLGHRGSRARGATPVAGKRLTARLAVVIGCGLLAIVLGSADVRWSLFGCGTLATIGFAIAGAGKHRTLGGQLMGVIGLSAPSVPILLSGSFAPSQALGIWCTWMIGFTATTLAVRGVIASQKRQSRLVPWCVIASLSGLVAGLALVDFTLPIATLPMLTMSWYLLLFPPPAKQLRQIGWTLVAGTLATAAWIFLSH